MGFLAYAHLRKKNDSKVLDKNKIMMPMQTLLSFHSRGNQPMLGSNLKRKPIFLPPKMAAVVLCESRLF